MEPAFGTVNTSHMMLQASKWNQTTAELEETLVSARTTRGCLMTRNIHGRTLLPPEHCH